MLKRLYVDNYKSLQNFEFVPQRTQLLMGANGTGKSSVLDVLLVLRQFITGKKRLGDEDFLLKNSLTRWDARVEQTFELDLEGPDGLYNYRLVIEHKKETNQSRVRSEILEFQDLPLLRFIDGEVTIFRETHQPGPTFAFNWSQSAFVTLLDRSDNQRHRWFRGWLGNVQVVRINPFSMNAQTDRDQSQLETSAGNFVSWYHHLIGEATHLYEDIRQSLTSVWAGFSGLRFEDVGPNSKTLKVVLRDGRNGARYELSLDELSDGQRALIVLYTLLHYVKDSTCSLVGFDEPANFVALTEIQPWIVSLCQAVEDQRKQAFIISHHPELINYLAPQDAIVLSRPDGGPVRVKPFQGPPGSTLSPAEMISRGWESE